MDNLTHTLTALLLGRAGAKRLGPYATPALLVGANLPDIDLAYLAQGTTSYLHYHRTWSHSLLGAAVLGAGAALAFWARARRRHPQPHLFRNLLLLCWLGTFSHAVMDWSTAYGTQLLWPFNRTWYALDWFYIVDPWLLLILVLGLALPGLFRLIGEEIGARRSPAGARRGAYVALAAYLLLAAGRATLHADAVKQLQARLYDGRTPVRVGAFPTPLNPFRWMGVVETDSTFEALELQPLAAGGSESLSTFYKPESSPPLAAALATRTARVFVDWARFPHAQVSPWADGWRVEIQDLRYLPENSRHSRFAVRVDLNPGMAVLSERLRFGRFRREPAPED